MQLKLPLFPTGCILISDCLGVLKLHDYGNYMGEQILSTGEKEFDETIFSTSELKAIEAVINSFKKATVNEIVNTSHKEKAWNENVNEFKVINYNYSFELKQPV